MVSTMVIGMIIFVQLNDDDDVFQLNNKTIKPCTVFIVLFFKEIKLSGLGNSVV